MSYAFIAYTVITRLLTRQILGKGEMQTYWVRPTGGSASIASTHITAPSTFAHENVQQIPLIEDGGEYITEPTRRRVPSTEEEEEDTAEQNSQEAPSTEGNEEDTREENFSYYADPSRYEQVCEC